MRIYIYIYKHNRNLIVFVSPNILNQQHYHLASLKLKKIYLFKKNLDTRISLYIYIYIYVKLKWHITLFKQKHTKDIKVPQPSQISDNATMSQTLDEYYSSLRDQTNNQLGLYLFCCSIGVIWTVYVLFFNARLIGSIATFLVNLYLRRSSNNVWIKIRKK